MGKPYRPWRYRTSQIVIAGGVITRGYCCRNRGGLADIRVRSRQSYAVDEIINEQTEDEMLTFEIPYKALKAAAFAGKPAAYTEFAYCTRVACAEWA